MPAEKKQLVSSRKKRSSRFGLGCCCTCLAITILVIGVGSAVWWTQYMKFPLSAMPRSLPYIVPQMIQNNVNSVFPGLYPDWLVPQLFPKRPSPDDAGSDAPKKPRPPMPTEAEMKLKRAEQEAQGGGAVLMMMLSNGVKTENVTTVVLACSEMVRGITSGGTEFAEAGLAVLKEMSAENNVMAALNTFVDNTQVLESCVPVLGFIAYGERERSMNIGNAGAVTLFIEAMENHEENTNLVSILFGALGRLAQSSKLVGQKILDEPNAISIFDSVLRRHERVLSLQSRGLMMLSDLPYDDNVHGAYLQTTIPRIAAIPLTQFLESALVQGSSCKLLSKVVEIHPEALLEIEDMTSPMVKGAVELNSKNPLVRVYCCELLRHFVTLGLPAIPSVCED